MGVRHDGDGLVNVIEDHHSIVESKRKIGQLAIVRRGIGQMLIVAHGIVTGIADGTAAESGQSCDVRSAIGRDDFFQFPQGIRVLELFARPMHALHPHLAIECFEPQERPGPDKAISPQPFPAHDALEEKRPVAFLNFAEGTDRRQSIADEPAIDRHHRMGTGKFEEIGEGGRVEQAKLR